MGVTLTIPFDNPANYTFPSTVEVSGGAVRLDLEDNPGQDFAQDFTNPTGITFDPAKTEIVGDVLRQKDQRPANSIVAATYESSLDANWGADGFVDLSANLNGSPSLNAGKLDCRGVAANGLYYRDILIGALSGDWVAKFKYTPNYTGGPSTNVNIFSISQDAGTNDDLTIFNSPSGNNIRISANGLSASTFLTWSPVAGQEYVFEIHCVSNQVSVFIDGVQLGFAKTISPGQGTDSNRVWLGAYPGIYNVADGEFNDFILYSVAAQTPVYTIPETAYFSDQITMPELEYTGAGTLISFDSFAAVESNEPRYTLQIGQSGDYLYWDGAAWSVSDGTYAQASSAATFNSQGGSLPVNGEVFGQFRVHTADRNTQIDVTSFVASLTVQIYSTTLQTCLANASVIAELLESFEITAPDPTGSDEYRFRLYKAGVAYWFDGAQWSVSTDVTESNTTAEIQANLSTFTTTPVSVQIETLLVSGDGTTTPEVDTIELTFDFAGDSEAPTTRLVYGKYWNPDGSGNSEAISAKWSEDGANVTGNNQISDRAIYATPLPDFRWEMELVPNEGGTYYTFQWPGRKVLKTVPAGTSPIEYDDLADYEP